MDVTRRSNEPFKLRHGNTEPDAARNLTLAPAHTCARYI